MARCGYTRRKIYRLLSVRSALLSVSLMWLLFIGLTMYYTQSMENIQLNRQLIHSDVQEAHIQKSLSEGNALVLAKPNQKQGENIVAMKVVKTDVKHEEASNITDERSRKNEAHEEANYENAEFPDDQKPEDNKEHLEDGENEKEDLGDQGKKRTLVVSTTAQDFVAHRDQSLQKLFIQPDNHSLASSLEYVEFVWNGDKPRPVKKFISPGTRFDQPKLGELGVPVEIRPQDLTKLEREKYYQGWKNHKFNEYVSLHISTQRQPPDYRPDGCKDTDQISHLQKASIIICFFNEAWSVLLRTIHSVLTQSPTDLIEEIILVDDHSEMVMMHEPLEYYVAQVDKLRLLRMSRRSGLVKARLAGVKEAKGPILIFLDSHVECEEGWLPPLLETILDNPNFAVTPEIDVIDHKDFSIQAAVDNIGVISFGGFLFDWANIMPRIKNARKSAADPIRSPAMAGGLFAIRKDYFVLIGTYDPGLEIWGGENIELSLKLWTCGGGILIHPCSRVAHIFRDDSPYLQGKTADLLVKNSARVAQVWADEYRDLYFHGKPYNEKKYGSVQERQELRKRLQCHSFSWYLENIYPEMYIKFAGRFLGKITSMSGLCIHKSGTANNLLLMLVNCRKAGFWEATRMKEIRFLSRMCMDALHGTSNLVLKKCDLENSSQTFEYLENKSIWHQRSNSCLTENEATLTLQPCHGGNLQIWSWPENENFIPPSVLATPV